MKKYYKILGLDEGASQQDIESAYNRLSKELDPANNDNLAFFKEEYDLVQLAYKELTGKVIKVKTDSEISSQDSFSFFDDKATVVQILKVFKKANDKEKIEISKFLESSESENKIFQDAISIISKKEKVKNSKKDILKPKKELNIFKTFSLLILFILPLVSFVYIQLDNKNNSKNFFSEANSLYLKDSLNESIVKLNQSLGTYYLPKSLKLKADIRFKQRRYNLSSRHYKKLINEKYESDSIKIDYGHSLIKNDEFSLGMSFISKGIRSGKNSFKYNLDYANDVASNYNEHSERDLYVSLAILQRTTAKKLKSNILYKRALLYFYLNKYSESIYDYTLYMDIKQNWGVYFNRGLSYYYNGEYEKSISDLKKSLTFSDVKRKEKGKIYNRLGKSYYSSNQLNKSYYNFKMAMKNGFAVSESTGSTYWWVKRKLNR